MNIKIIIGILAAVLIVGGGIYFALQRFSSTVSTQDETAHWNSYTYTTAQSAIFSDITFKYPPEFGNGPTSISSSNVNPPEHTDDNWGGFVDFSPAGAFEDHFLRLGFYKLKNSETSFENYVAKQVAGGDWGSPKYFQVGTHNAARLRFATPSHYDAGTAWYYIELSDKTILAVPTDVNPKYLFDDDQNGNSTTDKIISSLTIAEQPTSEANNSDWKTYTNAAQGYSIRFPSDAEVHFYNSTGDPKSCLTIDWHHGYVSIGCIPGRTGVGTDEVATSESITIAGKAYKASGFRDPNNFLDLNIGTLDQFVVYGTENFDKSNPDWKDLGPLTEAEYTEGLNSARQIVLTFMLSATPTSKP